MVRKEKLEYVIKFVNKTKKETSYYHPEHSIQAIRFSRREGLLLTKRGATRAFNLFAYRGKYSYLLDGEGDIDIVICKLKSGSESKYKVGYDNDIWLKNALEINIYDEEQQLKADREFESLFDEVRRVDIHDTIWNTL